MNYLTKGLIIGGAMVVGVVSANAAGDPIANRKALMKTVGTSMKAAAPMARGKVPFDAVKAELAARAINAAAHAFGQYFPANSKTGGKTTASPKIWEDMAGFAKLNSELMANSAALIVAAKGGEAAFKTAFGNVGKMCRQCHKAYRVKR